MHDYQPDVVIGLTLVGDRLAMARSSGQGWPEFVEFSKTDRADL